MNCLACLPARAQDVHFLPELDAHLKLNSSTRVYFEAKDDREGGDPQQVLIGPGIQYYRKPLVKLLKDVRAFDLDDSKARLVVLEAGYRYVIVPNAAPKNRLLASVTFNLPMKAGFALSDRNRADLDWRNGSLTWRYRNKFTLDRTVSIHSFHHIPYVAVEPFYESQYYKWSNLALYAGCLFPIGKHVQFNTYYEHETNTSKDLRSQKNEIGVALHLYFSMEKK